MEDNSWQSDEGDGRTRGKVVPAKFFCVSGLGLDLFFTHFARTILF